MTKNFLVTGGVLLLGLGLGWVALTVLDPLGEQALVALGVGALALGSVVGAFGTLVAFFAVELRAGQKHGAREFHVALRRGLLLAVGVVGALGLQYLRLLGMFEMVMLTVLLVLVEWIALSVERESGTMSPNQNK